MDELRGRCLCGAVEFVLEPPTDFVAHCHCRSCQRSHGAPFVTWTSVPKERFAFTKGEERIRWFRSSEHIEWGFCAECGSSMLYRAIREGHPESPSPLRMYVTAASLEGPLDRPPKAHVSYEEKLPWLEVHDGLPKHVGKTDETVPDP